MMSMMGRLQVQREAGSQCASNARYVTWKRRDGYGSQVFIILQHVRPP
jgi:hypothetical protein